METTTTKTKAVIIPANGIERTPSDLLTLAIQQNLDIEKLERLMLLQERYNAEKSRKLFLTAMSEFQGNCPIIEKKKKVAFGNTKYSYADLGEISSTLKDVLKENGLTYRWEMEDAADKFKCTCIISHVGGHSERTSMTAGKDISGGKNDIQSIASACTYLQRYTLIGSLGLTTANEDTDGRTDKVEPQIKAEVKDEAPSEYIAELQQMVEEKKALLTPEEYKRAKKIIKDKESSSYVKLRNFLKSK